jgi:hypothetical protein
MADPASIVGSMLPSEPSPSNGTVGMNESNPFESRGPSDRAEDPVDRSEPLPVQSASALWLFESEDLL